MSKTRGKSKEAKPELKKRSSKKEDKTRDRKLKRVKREFKEDKKRKREEKIKEENELETLKAKIRKSKMEKNEKPRKRQPDNKKRSRRGKRRSAKVNPNPKSKQIRAKGPSRSRRHRRGRNGRPSRKKRNESPGSESSSSLDLSSISPEESQPRPRRRRGGRRRFPKKKHFDTTTSSSDSESDFEDNVDPKQREKQVRLARLRALQWEKLNKDKKKKEESEEEVSFHGSVSMSDVERQDKKAQKNKADSDQGSRAGSEDQGPVDLETQVRNQEQMLLQLQRNPEITEEALSLARKDLEDLKERAKKEQEERLLEEINEKYQELHIKEINGPKTEAAAQKKNELSKLSAQTKKKEANEMEFMVKTGMADELEQGLDLAESTTEQKIETEQGESNRLAIIELSKNLKPKFNISSNPVDFEKPENVQTNGVEDTKQKENKNPKMTFTEEEEPEENGKDDSEDELEKYMQEIQTEAVEQEEFNYNAVRNTYLPIEKRKDDIGGLKVEDEEEEEEETNIFTEQELFKLMKIPENGAAKAQPTFNVPRKPQEKEETKGQENESIQEEEVDPEYDEEEMSFINALKNSTVMFGNQVEDKIEEEKKEKEKEESEDEFCDDNEVEDHKHIEDHLKKTSGMESSSQKIDKIRTTYLEKKKKMEKKKVLKRIDHSSIIYEPVRKELYRESTEISNMTEEEVIKKRKDLGDIKIRGVNQIKPLFSWYHCGMPSKILRLLVDKLHYKDPFPIQCQCIPIILSGRDCIGVAETGSGKTLAYVLPMIRHIKDQRPLAEGDGPVALIMVPTRELAAQVFSTVRLFCKVVGLKAAAIFGGASVSSQFSDLKKGAEVVVSTPGRLIDILTTSNGKITNLRRVTYIVLDEADRMFDLGFEPQINRIIGNVRPSRQTVLFSATFPRNVEALAKRILRKPLEVVVGTRGQASKNVQQVIEIMEEDKKLYRLLELLGIWTDRGSVIVFVDQQAQADSLFQSLLKYKYVPLLLHGGQDQDDRTNTISEFKKNSKKVLITTSLGARGLDIKWVILVVNYFCPAYKEDYIHRIGRTGRAGRKGYSVTMITPEEDKFAGDMIQALQISNSEVPQALMDMYQKFREKVMRGEAQDFKNKNRDGRGFKFDHDEIAKFRAIKKIISKQYGFGGKADEDDVKYLKEMDGSKKVEKNQIKLIRDPKVRNEIKKAAVKAAGEAIMAGKSNEDVMIAAQNAIRDFLFSYDPENPQSYSSFNNERELKIQSGILKHDEVVSKVSVEFEIDSYPEITRKKITGRDYLAQIGELTLCQISVRGILSKGTGNVFGQKKLHIFIEGDTRVSVMNALYEINKTAEESAMNALSYGR